MGRTSRPVSHGKLRSLATVCSRRTTCAQLHVLVDLVTDHLLQVGDFKRATLQRFLSVNKQFSIDNVIEDGGKLDLKSPGS
jgi:hypothetical protein